MRRIKKQIRKVTIHATEIYKDENGKLIEEPVPPLEFYVDGNVDFDSNKANALLVKEYGEATYMIDLDDNVTTYVMSAEDFIKYGTELKEEK